MSTSICEDGVDEERPCSLCRTKTTTTSNNNLLPLGSINAAFVPYNFKIRHDIETLRGRIQKAVDMISTTFGCQFTFSLEPGCKYMESVFLVSCISPLSV